MRIKPMASSLAMVALFAVVDVASAAGVTAGEVRVAQAIDTEILKERLRRRDDRIERLFDERRDGRLVGGPLVSPKDRLERRGIDRTVRRDVGRPQEAPGAAGNE